MSRTLSLITIVAIAFAGFASAAPAQVANPSFELAKRDKSFKGTGTFFHPATEGGSTGACGPDEGDNSDIVALNAPQYGDMGSKSKWCGKKITIKGPAGTATAKVNDACPECKRFVADF
jgi:expansin (peptidoglycan-binding protein)